MKEYGYSIDLPHSADRIWALMQDYDKWPEFAKPMVTGIEIVNKGDENGNGLIRRVNYKLPLGFKGTSIETISDIESGVGYTYTSLKGTIGKIKLEPIGENNTRLHFEEKLKLKPPFSWFEGRLQKFMEKYNRKTMLHMGEWLTEHPQYGLD
jgi:ribosome-associated toxin RatA of RatAB toxin-antitoxin module